MVSSTFPSISFYIKPTLIETMQKQLHLQAWNPLACLPSPPAGCSVCWWSLYLWKDWMGICNENGTRHTRTVKDEEDSLKRKVKETMEKAFWDSVMESMKLEEPDYSCISNLMRDVRDELCQMVPDSWKVEITETIDLDLLSQLLNSGTLDIDYLGKMLEFALATLRKLSAPANDRENESTHQSLLEELHRLCQAKDESGSLHAVAIVKGIRFILEKIQDLKQ